MKHLRATWLMLQASAVGGVVGLGLFVFGHAIHSLLMWELLPLDYDFLVASIVFPVGAIFVLGLLDLDTIYELSEEAHGHD